MPTTGYVSLVTHIQLMVLVFLKYKPNKKAPQREAFKSNKKRSTNITQSDTISNPDNPGDRNDGGSDDQGGGNPYEDPSLPNYYSLPIIAVHGTANPNRNPPPNGIFWASNRNISSNNQYIFQTDSRFNLRVKALAAPTANSRDSNGMTCTQRPLNYSKLQE